MGMRLERVRYGREAAEALRRAIAAAKGGEPLAPVTVVVPSNHVGVAARRLLSSGALGPVCGRGIGLVSVTFVTPYRLADLLGAPPLAASGRRPVSTPVIAAALRAVLAERPGVFAPVAAHPATESALVATYRELRDLSTGALDALAATGQRAADVVRLHRAARARLEEQWYDEQDLITAAVAVLGGESGVAARRSIGSLVVHLPQRLSRHAALLLRAAGEGGDLTVVVGATGDERADAEVELSVRRLSGPAASPGDGGPTMPTLPLLAPVAAPDRTRIITASDADDEVRAAVRAVVDATRAGVPLDRIAMLHASPEPYARLIHEQLDAAGIRSNGASVVPLTARVAGRTLVQLLELPAGGFRRQDVFAWMASAPLLIDGRSAPVAAWERLSREAAVVAGRQQWDTRLATLADELELDAAAAGADPDAPAGRAAHARRYAADARRLRAFVLETIDDLSGAGRSPRPWSEHAGWARRMLDRFLGGSAARAEWPPVERKAADRVEAALDRLAALDGIEPAVGVDVFTRTLSLELESDLGRVGRFGEGVLVDDIGMGVGLDLDLVVILGLAEGTFPGPVRDDSLLPDDERAATDGELPLRRQRVDRQHRELLAALAGAGRHVLCVPRGDLRRSSERVPSRWVLDLASEMAGRRVWSADLAALDRPWMEEVPSFDAGLRRLPFPATAQEHRLRALMASGLAGARALTGWPDAPVAAGAAAIEGRRSARFTRFDGNLGGVDLDSPIEGTVSSTRMEQWAACPFAYLLRYLLHVAAVENPEDELRITALDRGDLVHRALERFILEVLARPETQQPAPDAPWRDADRERLAEIGEELCDEFEARGRTGRTLFWRRDRAKIVAELGRFLDLDDRHRRQRRTRPLAAELEFGFRRSELGAVPLALPDGRVVRFLGKADRVDVAEDGSLHVIDYKTGRATSFTQLSQDEPVLRGRKLQLPVYGVAARLHGEVPDAPVFAEYWFVSDKGQFAQVGYAVTPEVLERTGATLATMVEGMEAGVFPSHPTSVSSNPWVECEYCDPDGLGVIELRRAWERKRSDPALAPYAELAEPLDAGEAAESLALVEVDAGGFDG